MNVIKELSFGVLCVCCLFSCGPNRENKQASISESDETLVHSDSLEVIDTLNKEEDNNVLSFKNKVEKYEDPGRVTWQSPDVIIKVLAPLEGETVADIGAGTGYFTFRLARAGASVIAIDIEEQFLSYIDEKRFDTDSISPDNIETRLSHEDNPLLKNNEVDKVLMVNTYYVLNDRVEYLKQVKEGVKNGGMICIVDFKMGRMTVGPKDADKVALEVAEQELKQAGFVNVVADEESLQYQYIITAQKL